MEKERELLVLARNIGQKIMINDDIEIIITGIDTRKMQVKVGIQAPSKHVIDREEIYLLKRKENGTKN